MGVPEFVDNYNNFYEFTNQFEIMGCKQDKPAQGTLMEQYHEAGLP